MNEEIIVMIVSVIIHIPIWSLCLRIVDIKKNGGKIRDLFKKKKESDENLTTEECVGEFEDEDVRTEREKVLNICGGNNQEVLLPIVVKV